MTEHRQRPRRRAGLLAALAAVLAVVGATAVALATLHDDTDPGTSPGTSPGTGHSQSETASGANAGSGADPHPDRSRQDQLRDVEPVQPMDAYPPVSIRIASIGVDADVVQLGLDDAGRVEVPDGPDDTGWFTESVPPGVLGASVIAGHVTYNGPAVFVDLGDLDPGDRVHVTRTDGNTAVFSITRVETFPKGRFPTELVYKPTAGPALRLITCGGRYDQVAHRYADNVIAFAELVGSHR